MKVSIVLGRLCSEYIIHWTYICNVVYVWNLINLFRCK